MYTLVSAIAKPIKKDSRWTSLNIGDAKLKELFQVYNKILATLSNSFLDHQVCLDLDNIRNGFADSEITFNEFLIQNGNNTLPTTTTLPNLQLRFAKYADAFHAGYSIVPMKPGASVDAELPLSEKTAVHMTRPETDYSLFLRSCMVSVNGYFHFIDGGADGIVVQDAMQTLFTSNMNKIGILSFREIGNLEYVKIMPDMVKRVDPDISMMTKLVIDTDVSMEGKTIGLVVGGYLHICDPNTFRLANEKQLVVDTQNMPLLERYFESRDVIDWSSVPLQKTTRNPNQIAVDDFFSDTNIKAYFSLTQSFIVLIDNEEIVVEREYLRKTSLPNAFISFTKPIFPLIVGYGKAGNYWYQYEKNNRYAVNCINSLRANYIFRTVDWKKLQNVSSAKLSDRPYENSLAYYLKIGTQM